jgi:hypothetical protein
LPIISHPKQYAMKPVQHLSDDQFVQLVQEAVALPDAPSATVRAAIDLWPAAPASTLVNMAQAGLRLITAVLSFDSWAQHPAAVGMRSVASPTRHLLFSAMGRDIDLRISPVADRYALAGQVLGPDDAGTVELDTPSGMADQDLAQAVALDALGEFRLEGVRRGTYRLTLRVGHDEIVLPPIDVGHEAP